MKVGEHHVLPLSGRYHAVLSVLPFLALAMVFFFAAAFFLVLIFFQEIDLVLDILLLPTFLGTAMLLPFTIISVFMIRWHGQRRLEVDNSGLTIYQPKGQSVFVPWEFLIAVELRFSKPNTTQITLVAPAIKFTFTNLEFNLEDRLAFNQVFAKGFSHEKVRDFLYYLHQMAPHLSWRMSEAFKERFQVRQPPYDLEKMA